MWVKKQWLNPMWTKCHDLIIIIILILSFKLTFLLYSFTLIKKLFSSSLISDFRVVASAYLRLLILLQAILIPACNSSTWTFHLMCSAYKLNKQGDNKQPCHTPFSILNQSVVPYKVLTVASWLTYRFLRTQVRWPAIPISSRVFNWIVTKIPWEKYASCIHQMNIENLLGLHW